MSLAGVFSVAQHGVRLLLLVAASKSGVSWSAPLVHPLTQWLGAAAVTVLGDAFCVIFRAPLAMPELSASFPSFRALTTVSA